MSVILSSEAMRECENINFAAQTADPLDLMLEAGTNCALEFLKFSGKLTGRRRIVIFCGSGNNGGDGVVMASFLSQNQSLPVVLAPIDRHKLSASAEHYYRQLPESVIVSEASEVVLQRSDVVIDALLGTGCCAPMREPYKFLINYINSMNLPVFAVDVPSGANTDCCIKSTMTAAIGFFKDLFFTAENIEYCGRLCRVPLTLPIAPECAPNAPQAADAQFFAEYSSRLPRSIHKYQRGNVLICGGSAEYFQAPFLSARAALRSGAGLVRLALPFAAVPGAGTLAVIPMQLAAESGAFCAESFADLEPISDKVDVIAAGPGMGRKESTKAFVEKLIGSSKPLLLDADAIVLAADMIDKLRCRKAETLLTPHRGEAQVLAKALGLSLTGNQLADAVNLAEKSSCTVLLKGPRTVTAASDGKAWINTSGTPALATAGSGDTLTGLAAAEMCNHPALIAGAKAAFLHGAAGEEAAALFGERGVIADDLPDFMAQVRCRLEKELGILA